MKENIIFLDKLKKAINNEDENKTEIKDLISSNNDIYLIDKKNLETEIIIKKNNENIKNIKIYLDYDYLAKLRSKIQIKEEYLFNDKENNLIKKENEKDIFIKGILNNNNEIEIINVKQYILECNSKEIGKYLYAPNKTLDDLRKFLSLNFDYSFIVTGFIFNNKIPIIEEKDKKIKDCYNNTIHIEFNNKDYAAADSVINELKQFKIYLDDKELVKININKYKNLKDLRNEINKNKVLNENFYFQDINNNIIIPNKKEENYIIKKIANSNDCIYLYINNEIMLYIYYNNHYVTNININENKKLIELRNEINIKTKNSYKFYFIKNTTEDENFFENKTNNLQFYQMIIMKRI